MLISFLGMSRFLADLLGVKTIDFKMNLQQLERASGSPSVDIRLSSEIEQQAKSKISELGFDPNDTTSEELDQALRSRIATDDKKLLTRLLGGGNDRQALGLVIVSALKSLDMPKTCFALRHSAAKRLLKNNPPRTTMRKLGYRSVDSLLKREPSAVIFAITALVEPQAWKQRLYDDYRKLSPSDFEAREIEIFHPVRNQNWRALSESLAIQQKSTVILSKELGGVVLLPLPSEVTGATLATFALALQALNDIRIHSAFCKLQQVRSDFGDIIANSSKGDVRTLALMAGQPIPWHIIQSFYGKNIQDFPAELFEPHVQQEDLVLQDIEEALASIEPELGFWCGTSLVGYVEGGEVVSFNLRDLAISTVNNLSFDQRLLAHLRNNVWTELMSRYLQQDRLKENVLSQLDSQLVEEDEEPSFEVTFAGA